MKILLKYPILLLIIWLALTYLIVNMFDDIYSNFLDSIINIILFLFSLSFIISIIHKFLIEKNIILKIFHLIPIITVPLIIFINFKTLFPSSSCNWPYCSGFDTLTVIINIFIILSVYTFVDLVITLTKNKLKLS